MKIKLESDDVGHDLASVTALMKTLNSHQDEIEIRKQEVDELQKQGEHPVVSSASNFVSQSSVSKNEILLQLMN